MRTFVILFLILFFLSCKSHADILYDIMQDSWSRPPQPCEVPEEIYEPTEDSEPEHYSWDLHPINPYEDTEIIVDPYE